jgi:hypothetical protein
MPDRQSPLADNRTSVASTTPPGRRYLLIGLAWLCVAIGAGATGAVAALRPPAPQLVLGGLTVLLLLAGAALPRFRRWLGTLKLRQIVALHLTRFVGVYFIVLYGRGLLPFAFAVPGGWGDIIVAAGALVLVLLVPELASHRVPLLLWNVVGLLDILFVVATAARLALVDPASLSALLRLPLSLLPTFLVPLIIASHVLLFWRLGRNPSRSTQAMEH